MKSLDISHRVFRQSKEGFIKRLLANAHWDFHKLYPGFRGHLIASFPYAVVLLQMK